MKYTVDSLTPADEELLVEIMEALSKRHAIRYAAASLPEKVPGRPTTFDELPVVAGSAAEWAQRLEESAASGTIS